jgi:hypothetical protein
MRRWVLVLVALSLTPVACSDDEPEPLVLGDIPESYRITSRVEQDGEDGREVLTVRRPFDSRIETDDAVEIATLGRSSRQGAGAGRLAVAIPPGVAPGDARVERMLGTDLLRPGPRKTIAGRECQVFRTGQSLRLIELVEGDDVEVCIDAAGLVLEEKTDGRTRTATEVELDVEASFDVGDRTVPTLDGGGAVRPLSADSRTPGTFWELGDDLPLPHEGRYAVVPPQPEEFTDPSLRGRRVATLTDVLTDGLDLIVVDRGGSLGSVDVLGTDESAETVDVGDLGTATLVRTATGTELTVKLDDGRFVRVSGTVSDRELLAVARGMHEVDGGELSPIGEEW